MIAAIDIILTKLKYVYFFSEEISGQTVTFQAIHRDMNYNKTTGTINALISIPLAESMK